MMKTTTGDLPSITQSAHSHSTYTLGAIRSINNTCGVAGAANWIPYLTDNTGGFVSQQPVDSSRQMDFSPRPVHQPIAKLKIEAKEAIMTRRLVQVFIADPDENIPLADSLLYSGEQKLTDATDQELFFEIDIKAILEKYNATRIKFINKKVKERTEYLEPVKIRNLKMVVVNIATF